MKKILIFPVFVSILFLNFAFNTKLESETISLESAIKNKLISISFISNGKYSGKSVFCEIKNLKGINYKIVIAAGTYFQAPSDKEQDLIIPQEEFFVLKPSESKTHLLNGFCTNLSNKAPAKDGVFKLAISKPFKEMPQLLTFLKGKKYENHTLQDAIWTITNKSDVANVYGDDEKAITALRKELFKLTGQKETWYVSPQNTVMEEDRTINRETARISGELVFPTKKGAKTRTEVLSPEGAVKIKTDDRISQISGEMSFNFKVEVKGWKKGIYKVNVMEDSKIVKSFEFKV